MSQLGGDQLEDVMSTFGGDQVGDETGQSAVESEDVNHPAYGHRKLAGRNLKLQAQRMLKRAEKKLKKAAVGDCVAIFASKFDLGRSDPPNVIGVIINVENDLYEVGTAVGLLKTKLQRNFFEILKYKDLDRKKVPVDTHLSLREIITLQSAGYKKCNCTKKFDTLRCQCRANHLKGNSACHKKNSQCVNHD